MGSYIRLPALDLLLLYRGTLVYDTTAVFLNLLESLYIRVQVIVYDTAVCTINPAALRLYQVHHVPGTAV